MHFAQILSECIEALAQGQSVEAVLALHPDHAEELTPLLHLVTSLQSQSTPQLSDRAFQQGRVALADAAQRRRALSTPIEHTPLAKQPTRHRRFIPYRDLLEQAGARATRPSSTSPLSNGHSNAIMPRRVTYARGHRSHGRSRLPAGRRRQYHVHTATTAAAKRASGLYRLRQLVTVVLPIILILTSATLLRQAAISTPGSPLYGLKTVSEQGQGLLMTAAGEGATWHANQMLRRLGELAEMTDVPGSADTSLTGGPAVTTLITSVADRATTHADQALAAGALLPTTDQRTFLLHWLTGLEKLEQTLQQATTPSEAALTLLQKTKREIIIATVALDPAPTESLEQEGPSMEPAISTEQPTTLPVVTVPATSTTAAQLIATPVDPPPTATRVLRATAIPTPIRVPERIQPILISPTVAPTATPLPIMPQVIPLERQSGNQSAEESSSHDSGATDGASGPSTDNTDKDRSDKDDDGQRDESTLDEGNDSESPTSNSADDATATVVPTVSFRTPTVSTGEETVPTAMTSLPKPTGVSTVEPDETISAPALPTTPATPVDPGQDGGATATPVAQSTGIVLGEVPAPILVTAAPLVSAVPTVPAPTKVEEQGTTEAPPTRTRRPTATPTSVTNVSATRTPVPAAPTVATDSPPPTNVAAVIVTTVAEATTVLAP